MKKIKKLIFTFLGLLVSIFVRPKKRFDLCFVRLDAIGDYVLFRNFMTFLANSNQQEKKKVLLVGNIAWRQLAEEYDSSIVDHFVWIDRKKFYTNLSYFLNKVREIKSCHSLKLIASAVSREFWFNDYVVKLSSSQHKIGVRGDCLNIGKTVYSVANYFYDELVPVRSSERFEFFNNQEFFQTLAPRFSIEKPFFQLSDNNQLRNNLVFFIGGSEKYKRWKVDFFARLAIDLSREYPKLKPIICGGKSDREDSYRFESLFNLEVPEKIKNDVGKSSLVDLVDILSQTEILISNETCAPHIAVAANVPNVFVITNGGIAKRFTPYPKEIHFGYHAITYKEEGKKNVVERNIKPEVSKSDINMITPLLAFTKINDLQNEQA